MDTHTNEAEASNHGNSEQRPGPSSSTSQPVSMETTSEETELTESKPYWLYATRDKDKFPYNFESKTGQTGKFLIFAKRDELMEIWNSKIKPGVEEGRLGFGAKVSTDRPKPSSIGGGNEKEEGVICVYTYTDPEDKERVREQLTKLELGLTKALKYKTDEATMLGQYAGGYARGALHDFCIGERRKDGHFYTLYQGEFVKTQGQNAVDEVMFEENYDELEKWMHADELAKYEPAPANTLNGGSRKRVRVSSDDFWEWQGLYTVYTTEGQYAQEGKRYFHIKENESKTKDLLFPSEQFEEIVSAMEELLDYRSENEDSGPATVVEGVQTSHLNLYGQYSKKIGQFCLHFKALKKKFTISIPQSGCRLLFNQLQRANESLST